MTKKVRLRNMSDDEKRFLEVIEKTAENSIKEDKEFLIELSKY